MSRLRLVPRSARNLRNVRSQTPGNPPLLRRNAFLWNVSFDPEARLIDRDADLDIATFRIEEQELAVDGKIAHQPPIASWSPKPPDRGKGVFFAGFPRVHWTRRGPLEFEWGCYVGLRWRQASPTTTLLRNSIEPRW